MLLACVGPCVALCRGLWGWVGKTLGPTPARAVSGQRGAGLGKPQNHGLWGGFGKVEKQAGESEVGCVATLSRFTSDGNAVRSGVSGLSTMRFLGWVAGKTVGRLGGS